MRFQFDLFTFGNQVSEYSLDDGTYKPKSAFDVKDIPRRFNNYPAIFRCSEISGNHFYLAPNQVIGEGTYGSVHELSSVVNAKVSSALSPWVLKYGRTNVEDQQRIKNEVGFFRQIHGDPAKLFFSDPCKVETEQKETITIIYYYMILKKMPGESLFNYLDRYRNQLSYNDIFALVLAVAKALKSLHHKKIIHGDFTTANVNIEIVYGKCKAYLLDFGNSYYISQSATSTAEPYKFWTNDRINKTERVYIRPRSYHDLYPLARCLQELHNLKIDFVIQILQEKIKTAQALVDALQRHLEFNREQQRRVYPQLAVTTAEVPTEQKSESPPVTITQVQDGSVSEKQKQQSERTELLSPSTTMPVRDCNAYCNEHTGKFAAGMLVLGGGITAILLLTGATDRSNSVSWFGLAVGVIFSMTMAVRKLRTYCQQRNNRDRLFSASINNQERPSGLRYESFRRRSDWEESPTPI